MYLISSERISVQYDLLLLIFRYTFLSLFMTEIKTFVGSPVRLFFSRHTLYAKNKHWHHKLWRDCRLNTIAFCTVSYFTAAGRRWISPKEEPVLHGARIRNSSIRLAGELAKSMSRQVVLHNSSHVTVTTGGHTRWTLCRTNGRGIVSVSTSWLALFRCRCSSRRIRAHGWMNGCWMLRAIPSVTGGSFRHLA